MVESSLLQSSADIMNPSNITVSDEEPVTARRYSPYRLHPELFGGTFCDEWLHPDLLSMVQILEDHKESSLTNTSILVPYLQKEAEEIYSFHCFSPVFLKLFNEELAHFYQVCERHQIPIRRPNSSKQKLCPPKKCRRRPRPCCFKFILHPFQ